jgi:hypothetical protein
MAVQGGNGSILRTHTHYLGENDVVDKRNAKKSEEVARLGKLSSSIKHLISKSTLH